MKLDRRSLLQATGISLALPVMESMDSAFGKKPDQIRRSVFVCTALGLHPDSLWPKTTGNGYESTLYLDLLKEHRSDYTLFSGLSHSNQVGRQAHDSEMTWLTSTPKPGNAGFRNGISVDQVIANHFGYTTRFPSVILGSDRSQSQSYTSGGVMIPAQHDPVEVFGSMFLEGKPEEVKAQKRRLSEGRSILDQLKGQTGNVRRRLSSNDNHLLDDYLDSVRETERNIGELEDWIDRPKPKVESEAPAELDPGDVLGRLQLLMDMIPLMFQTDSTRVVALMIQDPHVRLQTEGVNEQHHILSHHGQDENKIAQLRIIESGIVSRIGGLLQKMKSTQEQGQRLLDFTSIVFGSNLGNANSHDAHNLPIMLAGGGFNHGTYVAHNRDNNTELSNLFLRMLQQQGIEVDSFGQSTGTLSW